MTPDLSERVVVVCGDGGPHQQEARGVWHATKDRLGCSHGVFRNHDLDSVDAYNRWMIRGLWDDLLAYGCRFATHALVVQWDGLLYAPESWDPAFLDYDYIGAPWPNGLCAPGRQVGNGGFSLRSLRLIEALAGWAPEDPVDCPEDVWICQRHGPALEAAGFRFAPLEVAARFSVENHAPDQFPFVRRPFGTHGLWARQMLSSLVDTDHNSGLG